jgi:hypothetical protein
LTDEFNKSSPTNTSEVVLVRAVTFDRHGVVRTSAQDVQKRIQKELDARPTMRLTTVQSIEFPVDGNGNIDPYTTHLALVFEAKEPELERLEAELSHIRQLLTQMLER